MADTGNSATIVFATTGFVANFHLLGGAEHEIEVIEDSHLGTTTYKTYIPGDLDEPGEFDCEFEWQGDVSPPARGTAETITVTHPVPPTLSNGATHAGTGFIQKVKLPEMVNNELQMGSLTVKWDGKTGPTYTAAT